MTAQNMDHLCLLPRAETDGYMKMYCNTGTYPVGVKVSAVF